jgi:hypothetical protein
MKRTLTEREKRTVRFAAGGLAIYLVLFFGLQVWSYAGKKRAEYLQLVREAQNLRRDVEVHEVKLQTLKKLMDTFQMDPARQSRTSLLAQASAAIQRAAMGGGVQLGPIRESPGRPSSRELASMQVEALGPVPMLMGLLHRLESLGYPLVIDALQFTADPRQPGMVKLGLTIVILDFEQWKEGPNA